MRIRVKRKKFVVIAVNLHEYKNHRQESEEIAKANNLVLP